VNFALRLREVSLSCHYSVGGQPLKADFIRCFIAKRTPVAPWYLRVRTSCSLSYPPHKVELSARATSGVARVEVLPLALLQLEGVAFYGSLLSVIHGVYRNFTARHCPASIRQVMRQAGGPQVGRGRSGARAAPTACARTAHARPAGPGGGAPPCRRRVCMHCCISRHILETHSSRFPRRTLEGEESSLPLGEGVLHSQRRH